MNLIDIKKGPYIHCVSFKLKHTLGSVTNLHLDPYSSSSADLGRETLDETITNVTKGITHPPVCGVENMPPLPKDEAPNGEDPTLNPPDCAGCDAGVPKNDILPHQLLNLDSSVPLDSSSVCKRTTVPRAYIALPTIESRVDGHSSAQWTYSQFIQQEFRILKRNSGRKQYALTRALLPQGSKVSRVTMMGRYLHEKLFQIHKQVQNLRFRVCESASGKWTCNTTVAPEHDIYALIWR